MAAIVQPAMPPGPMPLDLDSSEGFRVMPAMPPGLIPPDLGSSEIYTNDTYEISVMPISDFYIFCYHDSGHRAIDVGYRVWNKDMQGCFEMEQHR